MIRLHVGLLSAGLFIVAVTMGAHAAFAYGEGEEDLRPATTSIRDWKSEGELQKPPTISFTEWNELDNAGKREAIVAYEKYMRTPRRQRLYARSFGSHLGVYFQAASPKNQLKTDESFASAFKGGRMVFHVPVELTPQQLSGIEPEELEGVVGEELDPYYEKKGTRWLVEVSGEVDYVAKEKEMVTVPQSTLDSWVSSGALDVSVAAMHKSGFHLGIGWTGRIQKTEKLAFLDNQPSEGIGLSVIGAKGGWQLRSQDVILYALVIVGEGRTHTRALDADSWEKTDWEATYGARAGFSFPMGFLRPMFYGDGIGTKSSFFANFGVTQRLFGFLAVDAGARYVKEDVPTDLRNLFDDEDSDLWIPRAAVGFNVGFD